MLYVILTGFVIWVLAAVIGIGKNTVFTKPHTMSDAMVERTIRLSQRMMDGSPIGSKAWSESAAKFSAALNEQRRRVGLAPMGTYNQAERMDEQMSKEIIESISNQISNVGGLFPIDGESPNGFGKVSGYIFGFCMAICSKREIYAATDSDRATAIAHYVFSTVYDDTLGAGILFASAQTTQIDHPDLHLGYDLGRADAMRWFERRQEPSTLATLLSYG